MLMEAPTLEESAAHLAPLHHNSVVSSVERVDATYNELYKAAKKYLPWSYDKRSLLV
jgi:hypothetical protein